MLRLLSRCIVFWTIEESFYFCGEPHEALLDSLGLFLDLNVFDTLRNLSSRSLWSIRYRLAKVFGASLEIGLFVLDLHPGARSSEELADLVDRIFALFLLHLHTGLRWVTSVVFSVVEISLSLALKLAVVPLNVIEVDSLSRTLDFALVTVDKQPVALYISVQLNLTLILGGYFGERHQAILHLVQFVTPILCAYWVVFAHIIAVCFREIKSAHKLVKFFVASTSHHGIYLLLWPEIWIDWPHKW